MVPLERSEELQEKALKALKGLLKSKVRFLSNFSNLTVNM